jgi:hypothetical protein
VFVYPANETTDLRVRDHPDHCTNIYAPEWLIPALVRHHPRWRGVWNVVDDPASANVFLLTLLFACHLEGCAYEAAGGERASCDHAYKRSGFVVDAVARVRRAYPFFDRHGGHDHVLAITMDAGLCELEADARAVLRNVTLLTTMGVEGPDPRGCYDESRSIVIPGYLMHDWRPDRVSRHMQWQYDAAVAFQAAGPLTYPRGVDFVTEPPLDDTRLPAEQGGGSGGSPTGGADAAGTLANDGSGAPHRAVLAPQRTVLAYFRGSLTHPVREALVALHNATPGFMMRVGGGG